MLCLAACGGILCADEDGFLDRPLPDDYIVITTFSDWSAKMEHYSGKKVVLPDGFDVKVVDAAFAGAHTNFSSGRDPAEFSQRRLLRLGYTFGVKGHYDASSDAIVLDYQWAADDARPAAELMKVLVETPCPADSDLQKPDPWRMAFNGLISKPDNRRTAGMVRWQAERKLGLPGIGRIKNLFAGNILDGKRKPHVLIFNVLTSAFIPGMHIFHYYLFSPDAKIEEAGVLDGGSYTFGSRMDPGTMKLNDDKSHLQYHWPGIDLTFTVENSRLVLKEINRAGHPAIPGVFPEGDAAGKPIAILHPD